MEKQKSKLDLPFLIKLMDDDSPVVKLHVTRELKKYGLSLREKIKEQTLLLSHNQEKILTGIEHEFTAAKIKTNWKSIFADLPENKRLEASLNAICEYQNDYLIPGGIEGELDNLARKFRALSANSDPLELNEFLFKDMGYTGNSNDFYNPRNSNMGYVIQEKLGIPISLSCLFMLVGRRLGMEIYGCNIPGHFITRTVYKGDTYFIDCFNEGKVISELDLPNIKLFQFEKYHTLFYNTAPVNVIITRLLRNLVHAYKLSGQSKQEIFFKSLLSQTLKLRFNEAPKII